MILPYSYRMVEQMFDLLKFAYYRPNFLKVNKELRKQLDVNDLVIVNKTSSNRTHIAHEA